MLIFSRKDETLLSTILLAVVLPLWVRTRGKESLCLPKKRKMICLHSLGDIGSCFLFLKMKQNTSLYRLLSSNSQTSKLQINSTLWPCRQLNLYFNTNYIYLKHCKNEAQSITFRADPRLASSSMNPQKKKFLKKRSLFFMESERDEKRKNQWDGKCYCYCVNF